MYFQKLLSNYVVRTQLIISNTSLTFFYRELFCHAGVKGTPRTLNVLLCLTCCPHVAQSVKEMASHILKTQLYQLLGLSRIANRFWQCIYFKKMCSIRISIPWKKDLWNYFSISIFNMPFPWQSCQMKCWNLPI